MKDFLLFLLTYALKVSSTTQRKLLKGSSHVSAGHYSHIIIASEAKHLTNQSHRILLTCNVKFVMYAPLIICIPFL